MWLIRVDADVVEDEVLENRDLHNEPLARRLRNAAIDRTTTDAERVDDFVLDENGVLDLRELAREDLGTSVADPAKALATIRGRLGDAHEVSDLYDESEPEPPRWRFGLRGRANSGAETPTGDSVPVIPPAPTKSMPPLSRLSMVPLAGETDAADAPADTGVFEAGRPTESVEPEIDVRDEGRPTANCPKCMGLGRRDLFDRFSRVEFYSCDNCMHMWQRQID